MYTINLWDIIIDLITTFFKYSLTDKEKQERAHKKQLLHLAKEHEKARELERMQRYHMPLEKGKTEQEQDTTADKEPPQSEQSKWESDQMSSAVFRFGAKDRKGTYWIVKDK